MDFNEMINQVLYGLIMIAGTIIVPFLVKYLRAKIEESGIIKKLTENENMQNLVKDAVNQQTERLGELRLLIDAGNSEYMSQYPQL